MVMTRKELLEYTRSEKLDKLFILASQMDTLGFESVEQLESLIAQKTELERELGRLDERLANLNEEK
jgi:predicted YcjX-like family ATPase